MPAKAARSNRPQPGSAPEPKQSDPRFRWISISLLIVLGWLLYAGTLSYPFVFDDELYLTKNPLVTDRHSFGFLWNFSQFANYPKQQGLDPDLAINFILRPVSYATFYLNYAADGFSPRPFRAVNILIHCANAVLIFLTLRLLLSKIKTSLSSYSIRFISLGVASAFLVHPLQIESVTYIVQRFTSLAAFFFLATLLTHLLATFSDNRKSAIIWRVTSVATLLLGMLSKENVFTAPFILILVDWIVVGTQLKLACRRVIPHLACLPVIPILILLTTRVQTGDTGVGEMLNVVNYANDSPYHYALTQFSVVLTYLRLILWPTGLNLDPDYPHSTSLFQSRVIISLTLLAAIIGGAWYWYRKRGTDPRVALLFTSVAWFFITLGIDSSIVPLPDVMAEHRSYLPSIGAFTAIVCGLDLLRTRLASRGSFPYAVPAFSILWVALLSVATMSRNQTWRSALTLWQDSTAKSPNKARPWFNLAGVYYLQGDLEQAAACTRKVVQLEPKSVVGHVNLATSENLLGHYDKALEAGLAGLRIDPNHPELYFGLGLAYAQLADYDKSFEALQKAISLKPNHYRSQILLGQVYTARQQYEKAMEHFHIAAKIQPLEPEAQQVVNQVENVLRHSRETKPHPVNVPHAAASLGTRLKNGSK